jgi:hypothetical protein
VFSLQDDAVDVRETEEEERSTDEALKMKRQSIRYPTTMGEKEKDPAVILRDDEGRLRCEK